MNTWEAEARRLVRERLAAESGRVAAQRAARWAARWAEVEAEAWQEVRAVVKAAMVEALLEELGQGDKETGRQGDKGVEIGSLQVSAETGGSTAADTSPAPRPPGPLAATGLYIYGIIDRADLSGLSTNGVAEGHPVTLQPYRDLAAVVSAAPLAEFGQEALEANLGDMVWLETRARAHQAVLDALLALTTLVPMKFATIYYSPAGVEKLLAEHYDEFVMLLSQLRGRGEWGLKLYCDETRLAAHLAEISPEVRRLQAEIESKPKGAAYLLARKLQEISEQEVERVSLDMADNIHTALAALSAAAHMNPVHSEEITGRPERMLLNAAYLVDNAALEAFRAVVDEQAAEPNNRGFEFQLTGPWPPYNFVALHVEAGGESDG